MEGMRKDARSFCEQIRRLTWQKITLRHQETAFVTADNISQQHKFVKFTQMTASGSGNDDSQDMSDFIQFLKDRSCGEVISVIFPGLKVQDANQD